MIGQVWLRPVAEGDREVMWRIEQEHAGNVMANAFQRTAEQFALHWPRVHHDAQIYARMIEFEADGETAPVGLINTFVTSLEVQGEAIDRRCVGYRLGEAWWGRGIASRALGLLLGEVRDRPLWAVTAAANIASQRVLAKCGFGEIERRWSPTTERYPAGDEAVFVLR